MMTDDDFIASLEDLVRKAPQFRLVRNERTGDILLRRIDLDKMQERAKTFALAFRGIMSSDPKKTRGGGWI
jgi:hypothetical protein